MKSVITNFFANKRSVCSYTILGLLLLLGCHRASEFQLMALSLADTDIQLQQNWGLSETSIKKLYLIAGPKNGTIPSKLTATLGFKPPATPSTNFYQENQPQLYLLMTVDNGSSKNVLFGRQHHKNQPVRSFGNPQKAPDMTAPSAKSAKKKHYLVTILFSDTQIREMDNLSIEGHRQGETLSFDFFLN